MEKWASLDVGRRAQRRCTTAGSSSKGHAVRRPTAGPDPGTGSGEAEVATRQAPDTSAAGNKPDGRSVPRPWRVTDTLTSSCAALKTPSRLFYLRGAYRTGRGTEQGADRGGGQALGASGRPGVGEGGAQAYGGVLPENKFARLWDSHTAV